MMAGSSFHAHITKAVIDRLQPGDTVWDTELKGFFARRQVSRVSYLMKTRLNGKQKWLTVGRHGEPWTPTTARKRALELKLNPEAAASPAGAEKDTLQKVIEHFRELHFPKLKPRTREDYDYCFSKHVEPALGQLSITSLDTSAVAKLHASMKATPRRANTVLAVLSKVCSWSEEHGYRPMKSNPCIGIKKYPERRRERFLSPEEIKSLLEAVDQQQTNGKISFHAAAAIKLLVFTGARLSEVLTLQWRYVDLEREQLHLPDSKTGQKTIYLNHPAIEILNSLPRLQNNPYVIIGKNAETHMVTIKRPWALVCEAAGFEDLRLHDLRHSFASLAAAQGASLPMIGKLLGHSNPATTARYAHLADAVVHDVSRAVGAGLSVVDPAK